MDRLDVDSITLHKDDIEKVKEKLEKNTPAIMLAHEPDFADTTSKLPQFILQLSGHSHGGQVNIPLLPQIITSLAEKYVDGFYS